MNNMQKLNEEIDSMIDELHEVYMKSADENIKNRLDAQISILWKVKDKVENILMEGEMK